MNYNRLFALGFTIVLIFTACKKDNENLIEGTWDYESIRINDVDARIQYGITDSCKCEFLVSTNDYPDVRLTRNYEIKSLSWKFDDSNFIKSEIGDSTKGCNENTCLLISTSQSTDWKGEYSISEEGKGDQISIKLENDLSLDVKIISLDKEKLTVEYDLDSLSYNLSFLKRD